ncbi:MAG: mannose-1-phosphate guanylyltransferase [Candidatus Eisenbacteria bacterium]
MIAVIMAGGSGTRFWPRSTESEPKQFLPLLGGRSLLADTVDRIAPLVPPERVVVVTGEAFVERTRREAPGLPPENVLGEPLGRNTAPCIALAAAWCAARFGEDEVMIVLPADHHVGKPERFLEILRAGGAFCAEKPYLLTIGIRPTGPETGYGYLEIGGAIGGAEDLPVHRVDRFVEKPDRATAEKYLRSGRFLWNSGMFLWRTAVIVEALERHVPESREAMALYRKAKRGDLGRLLEETYPKFPALSIDYAVMEKAEAVAAIPADFPWSDVGSWSALGELLPADGEGNRVSGRHAGIDTKGCVIYAPGRLVATIGVENLIVVETERAVLVCPKERAQEVKAMVERLRASGRDDLL